ncbi:MAG: nitroreductase family protein [Coriobacteriia bacterium]|nr:nitroreductase family protein [Coriobacteriia bacterium]MCL2537638.1 nitroreductase family protein [Coriobacteriia bacterium]
MNTNEYLDALAQRRTNYSLDKDIVVSTDRICEIVESATLNTPSAFNSQTARAVILMGEQHDKLWALTRDILATIVPEEKFEPTATKIAGFAAGAGTILYFDDMDIVADLQKQFPTFAENFPLWAMQANAMLQENIWTALTLEGLGVNLQHYNPLIDEQVARTWSIPASWKLLGQMVFGNPTTAPEDKASADIKDRVILHD